MKIKLFFFFCCFYFTTQAQERHIISSPLLKTNDTVLVFIPEAYQPTNTYPTLYLLHGWSGNYKNWSTRVDIQKVSNKFGFIIVCPDGFYNSWYMDNSDPGQMQWRRFFTEELYPMIQEKYHTAPEQCFISGLSMGGQGALNIFIDHPDWFRSAGSMSGVMDLRQTGLSNKEVSKVLGTYSQENPRFYIESVINRVEKLQPAADSPKDAPKALPMIISCGYDDVYASHSEQLAQKCKKLKIPHILLLSPGVHNWTYWDYALDAHLSLFTKMLKGESLGY